MTTTDANLGVSLPDLPLWVIMNGGPKEAASGDDDQIDSEVSFESLERLAGSFRGLPLNALAVAREAGASGLQLRKAEEMQRLGLSAQAKRQALCGVVGMRHNCTNTDCRRAYFQPFHCKCRYCLLCGGRVYGQLFRKHVGLLPVAEKLLASSPNNVVAKLDFTTVKLGRMPTRDEVRKFNECIKRFCRRVERELGISRKEYGLVYCDEFGGNNNINLHAHALYVGPKLPRPKKKGKRGLGKLAIWWRDACEETAFRGSFIISVKRAKNFAAGLAHALKYAGKFLSTDPVRLASLELAFHGQGCLEGLAMVRKPARSRQLERSTDRRRSPAAERVHAFRYNMPRRNSGTIREVVTLCTAAVRPSIAVRDWSLVTCSTCLYQIKQALAAAVRRAKAAANRTNCVEARKVVADGSSPSRKGNRA